MQAIIDLSIDGSNSFSYPILMLRERRQNQNKRQSSSLFSCIWSHVDAKYLVVELEGPVVDVDFLKLEVVNEVLEHVRHPDDPAAPPSAPPAPTTAQE